MFWTFATLFYYKLSKQYSSWTQITPLAWCAFPNRMLRVKSVGAMRALTSFWFWTNLMFFSIDHSNRYCIANKALCHPPHRIYLILKCHHRAHRELFLNSHSFILSCHDRWLVRPSHSCTMRVKESSSSSTSRSKQSRALFLISPVWLGVTRRKRDSVKQTY